MTPPSSLARLVHNKHLQLPFPEPELLLNLLLTNPSKQRLNSDQQITDNRRKFIGPPC